MKLRAIDLVWLLLVAATAFTAWLSMGGAGGRAAHLGLGTVALVLGIAWCKGLAVLLEFMELRHAPRPWCALLAGTLSAVLLLILLAYALGL